MTEHFNEAQHHVKAYIDKSLMRGRPLIAILDDFKSGPLPQELRGINSDSEQEIRRHGQLVGTRYLIKQDETQRAQLPDTDIITS
jgi:hypothetical protein